MEPGQNVLLNVEREQKLEPGLVQTQLQLMEVQVVKGRRLKLKTVTNTTAQVKKQNHENTEHIYLKLLNYFKDNVSYPSI